MYALHKIKQRRFLRLGRTSRNPTASEIEMQIFGERYAPQAAMRGHHGQPREAEANITDQRVSFHNANNNAKDNPFNSLTKPKPLPKPSLATTSTPHQ